MDYFNEIIQLSKKLIQYESIYERSGCSSDAVFGHNITLCIKEMLEYCKQLGFIVYMDPEGKYGYAETGTAEEYIALLLHLDVVSEGDRQQWTHNPFEMQVVDNKLIGRGVADDKVPSAIAVLAVKKLMDEGIVFKYPIRIIFGGDEETGFRCIDHYKKVHHEPKYTLVIDGTFPFSYSEKHLLNYELHTGSTLNVVGGVGYNSVMEYVKWDKDDEIVEVHGMSGHASRPTSGENALIKLAYLTPDTDILFDVVNRLVYPSGDHRLDFIEDEAIGADVTLNIGIVKQGVLYLDLRVPPEVDLYVFMKSFEEFIESKGLRLVEHQVLPGALTEIDSPFAQKVFKCYQDVTNDFESKPFKSGSATYGRSFKGNCLVFGPRMQYHITNTHRPNEFIPFDLIENAFEIYTHTLKVIEEEL